MHYILLELLCLATVLVAVPLSPQPYLTSPLLCLQCPNGWQMVFRGTAGNERNLYNAWARGTDITTVRPVDMSYSNSRHYRDPRVNNWGALQIQYVALALYKDSQEVAYVVFDGLHSTSMSWFNHARIHASSWPDVTTANTFNYFSVQGGVRGHYERRFFINNQYGGCDNDKGNLVVVEKNEKKACKWDDNQPSYPQILYAKNGAEYWNKLQFGRADYLAIYVLSKSPQ